MSKPFRFTVSASAQLTNVSQGTRYMVGPLKGDPCGELLVTVWPCKTGSSIAFASGGKTDEGYHKEYTTVEQDDDMWELEYICDWRDCDGRGSSGYTGRGDGTLRKGKAWSELVSTSQSQRDYAAEAAGY